MTLEQKFENIEGNLRDAYKQCVPGTMWSAAQLMTARRTNPELRNKWFYTAEGNNYCNENGEQVLYICPEMTTGGTKILNPVLKNIDEAFEQLTTKGNYHVLPADFDAVKNDPKTLRIVLNTLPLQGNENEWRYLEIPTSKSTLFKKGYDKLDTTERVLAERIYGQENDFVKNMKMLNDAGIKETRIYVLNPKYVKEHAKESAIGRASWLDSFGGDSDFSAVGRGIYDSGRVRGVRRASVSELVRPQGDAVKIEGVPQVPSAPQEIIYPTFDELLTLVRPYVANEKHPELEQQLRKRYPQ